MRLRGRRLCLAALLAICCIGAPAGAEEALVVYYSHSSHHMDAIVREFQERYDIPVRTVYSGTVDLAQRIVQESDNPKADVLWGGTPATYQNIAEYLQPYVSAQDACLDSRFVDPEGRWHGFSVCPVVIAYNTNLLNEEDAPRGYGDLVNAQWNGLTALGDPFLSSTALVGYLNILRADPEGGYERIEQLLRQAGGEVIASSADVYGGIASGAYAVGITYEEGVLRLMDENAPIQIVYPEEGTNLNCDGLAIIRGAPHEEEAKLFVDFLLGWDVQFMLGSMYRHSVRKDIPQQEEIVPLSRIPDVGYTEEWAAGASGEFLSWWESRMAEEGA